MVRWLERNGYDVSYITGVDSDRRGGELVEHRAFLSVGHDEYWSGHQRANVEAARAAGVNLAFFSGNEVFWKTRWEDGHRTLVVTRRRTRNAKIDPDRRLDGHLARPALRPAGRGRAPGERAHGDDLHGQLGQSSIERPGGRRQAALLAQHERRQPRRRAQTATLADDTLGYEWDEDLDNGARPAWPRPALVDDGPHGVERPAGLRLDLRGRAPPRTT